jgi:hypothetical protein
MKIKDEPIVLRKYKKLNVSTTDITEEEKARKLRQRVVQRNHYVAHREEHNERMKKHYADNKEAKSEYSKSYYQKNREAILAKRREDYAKKKGKGLVWDFKLGRSVPK